jgi:hypothetical protein
MEMNAKRPELLPSVARIGATFGIFLFHYLGMLNLQTYQLDFYCLLVFSFLTGYLTHSVRLSPLCWLFNRLQTIMIPYWLVMTVVFVVNAHVGYKPMTLNKVILAYLGCNMFVEDPIYVVTWYITFVLLLYIHIFIDFLIGEKYRWLLIAAGLILFSFIAHTIYYYISFCIGRYLLQLKIKRKIFSDYSNVINQHLFRAQKYCYSFFLLHGGILHFSFYITHADQLLVFFLALVMSVSLSIPLVSLASFLQRLIIKSNSCGIPKKIE